MKASFQNIDLKKTKALLGELAFLFLCLWNVNVLLDLPAFCVCVCVCVCVHTYVHVHVCFCSYVLQTWSLSSKMYRYGVHLAANQIKCDFEQSFVCLYQLPGFSFFPVILTFVVLACTTKAFTFLDCFWEETLLGSCLGSILPTVLWGSLLCLIGLSHY